MKNKYCIELAGEWYDVKKGAKQRSGWLDYELHDGTRGLARPGKWFTKEQAKAQKIKTIRTEAVPG
jgi:hypothetical protein